MYKQRTVAAEKSNHLPSSASYCCYTIEFVMFTTSQDICPRESCYRHQITFTKQLSCSS